MKKLQVIITIFAFLLCVILQTTVAKWISVFGATPDFLLIFIVYLAFKRGTVVAALWGFLIGFCCDIYGPVEWLGSATIAMTLLGFLVGLLEARFLTLRLSLRIVILALGFVFYDLIYLSLTTLSHSEMTHFFLTRSIPNGVYRVICGTLIFYFLFRSKHRKTHV